MNLFSPRQFLQDLEAPAPKDVICHPFHDKTHPDFVHPSRWCINRSDLRFFEKEVKQLWYAGSIPRREANLKMPKQFDASMPVIARNAIPLTKEIIEEGSVGYVTTVDADGEAEIYFPGVDTTISVTEEHLEDYVVDDVVDDGHYDETIGPSVYQVVDHYIKPVTAAAGGMSWSLMRNPEGLECDCFATHAWMEGVFEFILMLKRSWPCRSSNIYICFLSNPRPLPTYLLGLDPYKSPFYLALEKASYMVVLPNRKVSIYERLWCVFEAAEAVTICRTQDFKITLPWVADTRKVLYEVLPAFPLCAIGWAIGYFYLANHIGKLLGPSMWLLVTFIACSVSSVLMRKFITKKTEANPDFAHTGTQILIVFEYAEMFVLGVAFGLSSGYLYKEEELVHSEITQRFHDKYKALLGVHHFGLHWERGEGTSCPLVLSGLCLMVIYKISLALTRDVVKDLGGRLSAFKDLASAECSDKNDYANIHAAIDDKTETVERDVRRLIEIGRYSRAMKYNLLNGMSIENCTDGINPFKIAVGVFAWQFWWMTDLAGRDYRIAAVMLPTISIAVMLVAANAIGDWILFTIEGFMFCGLLFAVASNHTLFFSESAVSTLNMSRSTLPLQLFFACVMVLLIVFFHCGGKRELKKVLAKNDWHCLAFLLRPDAHPKFVASSGGRDFHGMDDPDHPDEEEEEEQHGGLGSAREWRYMEDTTHSTARLLLQCVATSGRGALLKATEGADDEPMEV